MSSFAHIYINVYFLCLNNEIMWDHDRKLPVRVWSQWLCCNSYIRAHDLQIWAYENYICKRHFRCSTLVEQRPMKSLSVCPSVRPSLSLLKIGSLIFSDIAWDDSWPWYLVTGRDRFLKKKIGPNGLKLGPKLGFLSFSEVWFISFLRTCIQWYLATMSNI